MRKRSPTPYTRRWNSEDTHGYERAAAPVGHEHGGRDADQVARQRGRRDSRGATACGGGDGEDQLGAGVAGLRGGRPHHGRRRLAREGRRTGGGHRRAGREPAQAGSGRSDLAGRGAKASATYRWSGRGRRERGGRSRRWRDGWRGRTTSRWTT